MEDKTAVTHLARIEDVWSFLWFGPRSFFCLCSGTIVTVVLFFYLGPSRSWSGLV
jgi:hypothetical protein